MTDDSIPRSIALLLLIFGGALFASAETAFSYCNRIRMKTLADDGDRKAERVMKLLDRFDDSIIVILIGTNVLHVVASLIATLLAISLLPWNEGLASLVASIVLTILIFIFSETIPKTFAKDNADALAKFYALPLYILTILFKPLVLFFSLFTRLAKKIASLFSHNTEEEPTITEDEFADMVETVEEHGILEHEESEIIKSAIEFGDSLVSEAMVKLEKVTMIDINSSSDDVRNVILSCRYSRIPVYRGTPTNIIGILATRRCLWKIIHGQDFDINDSLIESYMTSPDTRLDSLFEDMCRTKSMMAVVIDSFGQSRGIITLEDILEEIVGEIYDEDDPEGAASGKEVRA